jgi:hypothetical protein
MKRIYENYFITEDGKLFNERKQMKTYKGDRYEKVVLKINGKPTMKYIHRLVAEAYIDNTDSKKEVNHKDGNKLNNNVSNLEWVTTTENKQHAWSLGLYDNGILLRRDYTGSNNPNYRHGNNIKK